MKTKSKKTKETLKQIKAKITAARKAREPLSKEYDIISKKLQANYKLIEKYEVEHATLKLKLDEEENKVDWAYLLSERDDGEGGMTKYYACGKALENYSLSHSGYFPDIKQRCCQVTLIKEDISSYEKTLTGLKEILPFIKTWSPNHENEDYRGKKVFSIMEKTLSQYGVYNLVVDEPNSSYSIFKTTYGHTSIQQTFNSLEDSLKYIQSNVYYKTLKEEEEEEYYHED